jgi:hypothetical protein
LAPLGLVFEGKIAVLVLAAFPSNIRNELYDETARESRVIPERLKKPS